MYWLPLIEALKFKILNSCVFIKPADHIPPIPELVLNTPSSQRTFSRLSNEVRAF
jgi:hypothetical protein